MTRPSVNSQSTLTYNPATIQVGERVDYIDAPDDAEWYGADAVLRGRDLQLYDDGAGYVVAWGYARDGLPLPSGGKAVCPYTAEQPETDSVAGAS